jgi:hypothetical protein
VDRVGGGEEFAVDAVEARCVDLVDQTGLNLDDIGQRAAGSLECLLQVLEYLACLLLDITGDQFARLRLFGDVGRAHDAAGLDRTA